jgi:hypothetical protein
MFYSWRSMNEYNLDELKKILFEKVVKNCLIGGSGLRVFFIRWQIYLYSIIIKSHFCPKTSEAKKERQQQCRRIDWDTPLMNCMFVYMFLCLFYLRAFLL